MAVPAQFSDSLARHRIAISQYRILAPDWTAIRGLSQEGAADAVAAMLSALDGAEKQVFACRGVALILIEE